METNTLSIPVDVKKTPCFDLKITTKQDLFKQCTGMRIYLKAHNGLFVPITRKALKTHVDSTTKYKIWEGAHIWVDNTGGRKLIQVMIK